jgi:hypothetical protein
MGFDCATFRGCFDIVFYPVCYEYSRFIAGVCIVELLCKLKPGYLKVAPSPYTNRLLP